MNIGDKVFWVDPEPKDRWSLKSGWYLIYSRGTVLAYDESKATIREERVFGGTVILPLTILYPSAKTALIDALSRIEGTNDISARAAYFTCYGT